MEKIRKALYIAIAVAVLVAAACGVYVFGFSGAASSGASSAAGSEETAASSGSAAASGAASGNSGAADAAASSSGGSDSSSTHTHMWRTEMKTEEVPAVTHTETVTEPGEDIVEYHTQCDDCGAYLDTEQALESHYRNYPSHAKDGYTTGVPVVTGQKPGKTETKTVVDSPATTKTVTVKTCTVCGAVEEDDAGE